MSDNKAVFSKQLKVKGVTFNGRQETLKNFYDQHLSKEEKNILIEKYYYKDNPSFRVLLNDVEIGFIAKEDVYLFLDSRYSYKPTNIHIDSFLADYGQTIYFAHLFVDFYNKDQENNNIILQKAEIKKEQKPKKISIFTDRQEKEYKELTFNLSLLGYCYFADDNNFIITFSIKNYNDIYVQKNLSESALDYNCNELIFKKSNPNYTGKEIAVYYNQNKIGYLHIKFDIEYNALFSELVEYKAIDFKIVTFYDNNRTLTYYPLITILFHKIISDYISESELDFQEILNSAPAVPQNFYNKCPFCEHLNPYFCDTCENCDCIVGMDDGLKYADHIELAQNQLDEACNEIISGKKTIERYKKILEEKDDTIQKIKRFSIASIIILIVLGVASNYLTYNFQSPNKKNQLKTKEKESTVPIATVPKEEFPDNNDAWDLHSFKIVDYTSHVYPGANAHISIIGRPYTKYNISLEYSSGFSESQDLTMKTSDELGKVEWSWKIGIATEPGLYPITIRDTENLEKLELILSVD